MAKITEAFVHQFIVPAGTSPKSGVQIFDDTLPGFGIRKYPSGKAVFFVKYNVGLQQRRHVLGSALVRGALTDARREAARVLLKVRSGQDIVVEKRAAEANAKLARQKGQRTLGKLVAEYLAERRTKLRRRTFLEVERHLSKQWTPLHGFDVRSIARADVLRVVHGLQQTSGPRAADAARISLCRFFFWAIDHKDGYAETNPAAGIKRCAANCARERVLRVAELRDIWRACLDDDYGRIVRLLLLTGQRKTEIGDLLWSEVNVADRQVELPGLRTKNKRPHIVPLSLATLALLPLRRGDRAHVFGRRAGTGFSGWSKAKRELDARVATLRKMRGISETMPSWTIHDLRRSFVTHVLEERLALPHVAEACVNHVSGHKAGVAGIYNRAEYSTEKRLALEKWARWIEEIVA